MAYPILANTGADCNNDLLEVSQLSGLSVLIKGE